MTRPTEPGGAQNGGPDLAAPCARGGLLLSLRTDGAATPHQERELDAHLAACADCRRAARVDAAVGERLRARAEGAVPSGFAARVVVAALAQRAAAAAAQNRVLRWTAAAAVHAAASTLAWNELADAPRLRTGSGDSPSLADARDAARRAVVRPRLEGR
jgi:hypothetical protein